MKTLVILVCYFVGGYVDGNKNNVTINAANFQTVEFKLEHPKPMVLAASTGCPVDIRRTKSLNSNMFANPYFTEEILHLDGERIPERLVHTKGTGAHGYFEVTHDVSKYIKSDVFNGIGKKTRVFGRFSTSRQQLGGHELGQEFKAIAAKFYTTEGNLDFLSLHTPVFEIRDPQDFPGIVRAQRRNPKTNLFDFNMGWDFVTLRPDTLHVFLWLFSDYGIPYGYRTMDVFPIHTYEIYNKKGDKYYARFNFRTEQGLANLTTAEASAIASQDPDYFTRDLYNAIANKNYPSWRLEIDVISLHDIPKLNYNPFDLTRLWKKGTYRTVTIGRLTFDRNLDNQFAEMEQSAFNPSNLVPGITGGVDSLFQARVVSYRDTQDHRLGANHNKIEINRPKYAKNYHRDGVAPVLDNMKDAPKYYPNSFNGPMPYIDPSAPKEKLLVLESNAVDLEPPADFYNNILVNSAQRQRLADNIASSLRGVIPSLIERVISFMYLISEDLGHRVEEAVRAASTTPVMPTRETFAPLAQCVALFNQGRLKPFTNV